VAKYGLILSSDMGIRVRQDTLADMVSYIDDDDVAVVTQLPFMCDRPGFHSLVEKVSCIGVRNKE
jgi:ceramide glucosyltransferase